MLVEYFCIHKDRNIRKYSKTEKACVFGKSLFKKVLFILGLGLQFMVKIEIRLKIRLRLGRNKIYTKKLFSFVSVCVW